MTNRRRLIVAGAVVAVAAAVPAAVLGTKRPQHEPRPCRPGERPTHGESSIAVKFENGTWQLAQPPVRTEGC